LVGEAEKWGLLLEEGKRRLLSVYMGGGTPSLLGGREAALLLRDVTRRFSLDSGAEVTIEVNPATWEEEDFQAARDGGFNRFSLGVQCLDDRMLSFLGRRHTGRDALRALEAAMAQPGASVSVDLLLGLPGDDGDVFISSLRGILDVRPHHVSVYCLTLRPDSPLRAAALEEGWNMPGEREVSRLYLEAAAMLEEEGYLHYEISNFCIEGFYCRHNLGYWTGDEYLGLGAGAHSYLWGWRFRHTTSVLLYLREAAEGVFRWEEPVMISEEERKREKIILGLRTSLGVEEELLHGREDLLSRLEEEKLAVREKGRVRLTNRGMLVSNAVIAALLPA
jgi:oxygen-independent coproporphyrinogen-3 oxidase